MKQGDIVTHKFDVNDKLDKLVELEILKIVDDKALTWCNLYKEQWHELRLLIIKK